ncbi:MAG: methylmalonyl Co-A mutase-associated GTPase MeaB [Clostridiales bacterium]|nr:methylmalonyl Co-A mutase-associated GTPase MeaB [Clostridiales bacterium]
MDIRTGLLEGKKRAAARLITMLENESEEGIAVLKEFFHLTGRSRIIGITGPPGAGKSTVTDRLAKHLRKLDKKVAIIAVDPTSPFSGGAILGDRIRMSDLNTDEGIFIRSMGTRGALGGLSKSVNGAVKVMDIMGYDYIFIETVGVGQSEIDIVKVADTVVMVMVPGLGDDIQAIKAGIMEIGDIFAVNKSDREGAERTVTEIEMMLDLNGMDEYRPPVKNIIAIDNIGIDELYEDIEKHNIYMIESGAFIKRRMKAIEEEILGIFKENLMSKVSKLQQKTDYMTTLITEVYGKSKDTYTAASELSDIINKEGGKISG